VALSYFNKALAVSNRDEWASLVTYTESLAYKPSGYCAAYVLPLSEDVYQRNCVDYAVHLLPVRIEENLPPRNVFLELKTENFPAVNISVETHSDIGNGTPGWAFKIPSIRGQDLLTFFNDGTVFHAKLDDYRDFLNENRPRWEAEIAAGNRTYRPIRQESYRDGRTWVSTGFTIPLAEVREGMGDAAKIFTLPSPQREIAQAAIRKTSQANRGAVT